MMFDMDPVAFVIPYLHFEVYWYGILFAFGAYLAHYITCRVHKHLGSLVDSLMTYVIVGALIGARLGHFFFYESPSFYLVQQPWVIFDLRGGGLSSHGAFVGILLAIFLFSRKGPGKTVPYLVWTDLLVLGVSITAVFIRCGNFINQEILGTVTGLPWGITFLHPATPGEIVPRHPVQLYEALFYALMALFFYYKRKAKTGVPTALFCLFIFTGRFFLECLKEEQSYLMAQPFFLTMGQILSIPVILFGLVLYCVCRRRETSYSR